MEANMEAHDTPEVLHDTMDPRNTALEDRNFALAQMDGARFSWYHVRYVSLQ